MRLRDVLRESMGELAAMLDDIRSLPGAKVSLDPKTNTIYVDFVMHGEPGMMKLKARPEGSTADTDKRYRSRVYAAAVSSLKGQKPSSFNAAVKAVSGIVRNNALKILTNPTNWQIEKFRYAGLRIGLPN
jgi:hypothetical protein